MFRLKQIFSKYPFLKLAIPVVISLMVLIGVFKLVGLGTSTQKDQAFDSDKTVDLRELKAEDRPYIGLVPRADGHALILTVTNHQNFSSFDFEILYQAGTLQQGSIGQVDIAKPAYKTEITLGACSKGVCRYDDNVRTGSLKLNAVKSGQSYTATIPFVLEKITPEASEIVGPENTLDLSIQAGSVSSDYYVLISETIGVPIGINNQKGKPVAVFSIAPKLNRQAQVSLKNQNITGLKINRFDFSQNTWNSITSLSEEGSRFNTDYLGLFAFTQ